MTTRATLLSRLETVVRKEGTIYQNLDQLMSREVAAIEKFNPEILIECAELRKGHLEELARLIRERKEIQNSLLLQGGLEPSEGSTLTEVILSCFSSQEQNSWLPRIKAHRKLAERVSRRARSLSKLLEWSMSIVSGSVSIIRSISEEKVEGYGRNGTELNRYHPKNGRSSLTLEQG